MTRDAHVVGQAPDWSLPAQRFTPLVHRDARSRPMAVRRTVNARNVEALKARWFALGSLATAAPILIVYGLIRLLGGA